MHLLDLTLDTGPANLALDEALLDVSEQMADDDSSLPAETLRLWEPREVLVVVGRSSKIAEEVNLTRCRQQGVPVLRRTSGGAAIVAGPGCLMYSLVLHYRLRPQLRAIDLAHRFVLGTLARALGEFVPGIEHLGTSDLAIGDRKFSGNSMRCRRESFLYHGTLLYDFPLPQIEQLLRTTPRPPDYRAGRKHAAFLANLPLGADELRKILIRTWDARPCGIAWPESKMRRLIEEKYSHEDWNWKR